MSTKLETLSPRFYRRDPRVVACGLLGRYLVRRYRGKTLTVRIVETEAYLGAGDRASHAWTGKPTRRTQTLFRSGGIAYVYFVYGMHHMLNAVVGSENQAAAVLIRAAEPINGLPTMRALRSLSGNRADHEIASGPGKLCQALAIDRGFDGADLGGRELRISRGTPVAKRRVAIGPRVGVAYAGEAASWPLRFALAGSPHVSRPRL